MLVAAALALPVRVAVVNVTLASFGTFAAMPTVATVAEQMHRDERDEDQRPDPIRCKPRHDVPPRVGRLALRSHGLSIGKHRIDG